MTSRRPLLDRGIVLSYRRRSITDAFAAVCRRVGYREVSIAMVVKEAQTSRNTVYAQFENKEAILIELLRRSVEEIFDRVERACYEAGPVRWERIAAVLETALRWVGENPDAARVFLHEFESAGPTAVAIREEAIERFIELLREAVPADPVRPEPIERLVVGGVVSIARYRVVAGDAEKVPGLAGELMIFLETPYVSD